MTTTHHTTKETKRICNLVPSHNTENDWHIENALAANAIAAPAAALRPAWTFAPHVGYRRPGSDGACVGWGSTDSVARYHFVTAAGWPRMKSCRRASPGWRRRKPTSYQSAGNIH